ncbi:MAG: biotin--[acetyl-CoA-carboxylase] ligase [Chromatiales bacterium]
MGVAKSRTRQNRRRQLLACLADGAQHSGTALAQRLGISRTAVWQHMKALKALGAEVSSTRGGGYHLGGPVDLLDATAIRAGLPESARQRLTALEVHFETDSTNQRLLERAAERTVHGCACLAEVQRAGRGRHGRHWVTPPGCGLALSLAWRFHAGIAALTGLSLAMGVGVHRALQICGVGEGLTLKWPNDILWLGEKLGGILVEVRGESCGPSLAVAGVGLNVALPEAVKAAIEQPVTDLRAVLGHLPSRNGLAAAVLGELTAVMLEFEVHGFAAFSQAWADRDGTRGKLVEVMLPSQRISGRAEGVDANGALLVRMEGSLRRFHAGEVSVRTTR